MRAATPPFPFHPGFACRFLLVVIAGLALSFAVFGQESTTTSEMDRSVKPGDDFYRYANGGWLAHTTVGEGQASLDNRAIMRERNQQRTRQLVQEAAGGTSPKGSVTQKVGDYYATFLDEASIESKEMKPLAGEMAAIAAIKDKGSLSSYLGGTLNSEADGLTANADHVFGVWINQGFEDADHNLPHLWQGGLGLPDRDNYLDAAPKMAELRKQYEAHIAAVLKLADLPDAEKRAVRVMTLETKIAQAFAPDEDAADVFKQNNPWKQSDFATKAPGINWQAYFKSAGMAEQRDFLVWQPSAVTGVSALVGSESLDTWKDYLRFHLVEHYASVLPKAVREEHFAFYGKILTGAKEPPDRVADAVAATEGALGEAVGHLYTQRYFPPAAKAKAEAMAANLLAAFHDRIANLTWMSAATKQKALVKLAAFKVSIGYPDKWIDYSTLEVVRGDAFGNMRRAEAFTRARNIARLKEPVDPVDWPLHPQTPGAVIMFSPNMEFFSAGILQPPYFDADGDDASNYGSAGAGMAHEISHSFDELGNIYDGRGRLTHWWTAEDKEQLSAVAAKLAAQSGDYCPFAGACVNGKQVSTESIADIVGLMVAHDAYLLSQKGKQDVLIDGLTGEQRFFVAFARRWRKLQSDDALRGQIKSDTHLPPEYRSDAVRNVDEWYQAFGVIPGDKLYLRPEERVRFWERTPVQNSGQ